MKNVLSSIDLVCVLRELSSLSGFFVSKIYQVGDELIFKFSNKKVLRVIIGKLIHLTSYVKENPFKPPNFCMYLRKYFDGARLDSVSQPSFERVVILRFSTHYGFLKVVFELFSTGNVIVTDDEGVIKQCLKVQRFSARNIVPGKVYALPPSVYDLSVNDFVSFSRVIKSSSRLDLVRALAVDVGLGGSYAEEVCFNAGVSKSVSPSSVSDDLLRDCFNSLLALIKRARFDSFEPRVILKGDDVLDVVPFPLRVFMSNDFKSFSSFNEALDFFYAKSASSSFDNEKSKVVESKRAMLLKKISEQEAYVEKLKSDVSLLKSRAGELKNNLFLVRSVIDSVLNARRANKSWFEILKLIDSEKERGNIEASLIREVRPDEGIIVLDLAGGLEVPFTVDVSDFMSSVFDEAKKLEAKISGALDAVVRTKKELASVNVESVKVNVSVPRRVDSSSKEWFTRFKHFKCSDDSLCVSGRSAVQNEELINTYLLPDDLVFHAEIFGSPFTILRNGRKASDEVKREAALFTAAHSSAWQEGRAVDVFYVLPYQVSKQAPSGEYLKTGGFMISGKKTFFKSLKPELALGVELLGEFSYRVVSGPVSVVKKRSKFFVVLEPGSKETVEVTRELVSFFKLKGFVLDFEVVKACLPSGGSRVLSKS